MFKNKIRIKDIKAIGLFILSWPIALAKKNVCRDLWIISERRNEARDNGYWMFRYVTENYPNQRVCYVIDKDSPDKGKVDRYGDVIPFGSLKHYVAYWLASKHISAHIDSDSPNSRVSNFLETHGLLKNKRVFLQHGITKDKISFGYYTVSRADLFVCAAKPEYRFCKKEFGYPEGAVKLLGFARFDGLGLSEPKRQILMMPTWRAWLAQVNEEEFLQSRYYRSYQALVNNSSLNRLLKDNKLELIFYPHSDMQRFIRLFKTECSNIIVANSIEWDVQTLLIESAALITDYSSVAFDMAYMERPVVYFHFDYNEYRRGQHPEGYYSYTNDGFGPVCKDEMEVISYIKWIVNNGMRMEQKYTERVKEFFAYQDHDNCFRIYKAIKEL